MKCGLTQTELPHYEALPKWHKTDWGGTAGCPNDPASQNRVQVWLDGSRAPHGNCGMWCRVCDATEDFDGRQFVPGKPFERRERKAEIDESLPGKWHAQLLEHREYFKKRLISDEIIDEYKLGWNPWSERYAIPCYHEGKLSAIQYRINEKAEARLKAAGLEYNKYLSEKGGVNNVPFNDVVAKLPLLFIFIDEGPIDILTLLSLGYPGTASFAGNNASKKGWAWPGLIRHIPEVIFIAQNDEEGPALAEAKRSGLGRGRIVSPPSGFKDMGEYLRTCENPQRAMYAWCGLPPVLSREKIWQAS